MVSLKQLNKLLNFIFLQTVWFALVIGVAYDHLLIGVVLFTAFVVWQLHPFNRKHNDLLLIVTFVVLGIVLDSLWLKSGLVEYRMRWPDPELAPIWILMLWVAFALTINHSLAWIFDNKLLAIALGALGGPLSYLAAERLGAISISDKIIALPSLAAGWTGVMLLAVMLFKPGVAVSDHRRTEPWN